MLRNRFTLRDSFELDGQWWLPGERGRAVPGTLAYSSTRIDLNLFGSLASETLNDLGKVSSDFSRYPCIHGVTHEGQKVTVLDSVVTQQQHNLSNATSTVLSGIYLLIGEHIESRDALKLGSVSVAYSWLDWFTNNQPFTIEHEESDGDVTSAAAKYAAPPKLDVSFEYEGEPTCVSLETNLAYQDSRSEITLTAQRHFRFRPATAKSLDWYIKAIWRMSYLLTILTDEAVCPTWLRYSQDGESSNGWLLYRSIEEPASSGTESGVPLLLHLAHVIDDFDSIVQKWYSASDILTSAIHRFMAAHRDSSGNPEVRILMLTQSVEAFSRATTSSEYMGSDEYASVISALTSAIPDSVSGGHRTSLKNRIKFGNEHSLRKRITGLLNSLAQESSEAVCRSKNDFVCGVVDTRNYLTHYTDELRPSALTGVDLSWACEKLLILLRILLLREIGVEEGLVVRRIKEHHRLMQRIFISKGFRERA